MSFLSWLAKDKAPQPKCFGSAPNGQAQAENGCEGCPFSPACYERARWRN
jgi:hypothetical protein